MPPKGVHSSSLGPRTPEHLIRRPSPSRWLRLSWLRFDTRRRPSQAQAHEPENSRLHHRRPRLSCPAAVRRPAGHSSAPPRSVSTRSVGRQAPLAPRIRLDHLLVEPPPTHVFRTVDLSPRRRGAPVQTIRHHARRSSPRHRRLLVVLLVVIVVGVGAMATGTSATVRRQLLLSFTRQPDDFAELYFPSPSTLPTSFVPRRPLAIEFGLTNDSNASRDYTYDIVIGSRSGHTTVEGSGRLRVGANHKVDVPLRVSLPSGTTSLAVDLTDQPVVIRLLLHQGVAHAG
jgi:hypothetical protein